MRDIWPFFANSRRAGLLRAPLRDGQRDLLAARVRAYGHLSDKEGARFENCVKVMVGERQWEGFDGLQVTAEMQLTIAGRASLMLLGAQDYYFQSVTTILVCPAQIERTHNGHFSRAVGEAWPSGGVLLSWPEILADGRGSGRNVVIHEFAHHLDGLDGEMGGSIPFPDRADEQRWHEVADREYQRLLDDARRGTPTLLDKYGATNPAEFFAVVSECFFERPWEMQRRHSELFELLQKFYQVNPRDWYEAV